MKTFAFNLEDVNVGLSEISLNQIVNSLSRIFQQIWPTVPKQADIQIMPSFKSYVISVLNKNLDDQAGLFTALCKVIFYLNIV